MENMNNLPQEMQNSSKGLAVLSNFEEGLKEVLNLHSLPVENIFVETQERGKVFKNLSDVLNQIPLQDRQQSTYLSKFIAKEYLNMILNSFTIMLFLEIEEKR